MPRIAMITLIKFMEVTSDVYELDCLVYKYVKYVKIESKRHFSLQQSWLSLWR